MFEGDGRIEQGFHETVWQSTVVIKYTEHSSTGIAFANSSNITFRYITITNCGADLTNFCQTNILCNGSLGFLKISYNIVIDHLSIQNETGNGLLIESDGVDLIITDSSFAQNYIDGNVNGGNIAILYADPLNCVPQSYVYNIFILNTNTSFGDSRLNSSEGLFICLIQRSYAVVLLLDSVIAYGNKRVANIFIYAKEHEVSTYNLTIYNLLSFGVQGFALVIVSTQDNYKQCPVTQLQNFSLDFTIVIVNSNFTYNNNNNKGDPAVVLISARGVKFTTKILIRNLSQYWQVWAKVESFLL